MLGDECCRSGKSARGENQLFFRQNAENLRSFRQMTSELSRNLTANRHFKLGVGSSGTYLMSSDLIGQIKLKSVSFIFGKLTYKAQPFTLSPNLSDRIRICSLF